MQVTIKRLVLLAIFTLMAACGSAPPDEVVVQLKWVHQAQFAGFYAAEAQGYYAAENLAITFLPGGTTVPLVDNVVEGVADFGITGAESLLVARTEGAPIMAIATLYRRNPLVYLTLADSGITRPEHFVGQMIRINKNETVLFAALMSKMNISPAQYSVTNEQGTERFYAGEIQVSNGYIIAEALAAKEQGIALNLIYPDDYGIHFYSDTLFTTTDLIETNPDLVTRFLRASLRGWQWAIENPTEAGALALRYNPELDAAHQKNMMIASIPLVHTGEDQIGWMRPNVWQGMQNILLTQQIIDARLDLSEVYTTTFLEQIYGESP